MGNAAYKGYWVRTLFRSRYGVQSPSWNPPLYRSDCVLSTERSVSYDGISRDGSGITGNVFLA